MGGGGGIVGATLASQLLSSGFESWLDLKWLGLIKLSPIHM